MVLKHKIIVIAAFAVAAALAMQAFPAESIQQDVSALQAASTVFSRSSGQLCDKLREWDRTMHSGIYYGMWNLAEEIKSVYENYSKARAEFEKAGKELGIDLPKDCSVLEKLVNSITTELAKGSKWSAEEDEDYYQLIS